MNEYDVTLRLELDAPDVEAVALRVLEVVERRAAHTALEPVVSGTVQPPAIELEFDVLAASTAQVHEHVAALIGLVEAEIGPIRGASVVDRELVRS